MIGDQQGDQTVVTSGVDAGDVVVVDGVDKLQNGAKVTVGRAEADTRNTTSPPSTTATHTRHARGEGST